jgi:cation diffusion facilitator family transporter
MTTPAHERRKKRAAILSVASNAVLVVSKLGVGLAIGSVSVISEAIHSGVDLVAALIAWFAVSKSGAVADDKHPYGHGKIENLSGFIEALLIFAAAAWIIYEAIHKLIQPEPVGSLGWGFAVMAVSALMNLLVSAHLMRVGKATDSIALQADAWHLRTDVYTSAGVMAGLGAMWLGARLWPGLDLGWVDPVAAIVVALLILKAAWELTWQAAGDLLDIGLPPAERDWIRHFVAGFRPALTGMHDLRTRKAGAYRFIDLHIVVDHAMTVGQAHEIAEAIEMGIQGQFPGSTITVHLDPCDASCKPRCLSGCMLECAHRHRLRAERGLPPIDPPPGDPA